MAVNNTSHILFDLGNVLLDIDWKITMDALQSLTHLPAQTLFDTHKEVFHKFETGKIPYVVFFNYLTKISGNKAIINDLIRAWNAMLLEIQPDTWTLLHSLKSRFQLILFSNTNETHLKWFDQYLIQTNQYSTWYEDLFSNCYFSHQIGKRKPDVEAFEHILTSEHLLPDQILFIDDTQENIEGATAAGIPSLLFDRHTSNLKEELEFALQIKL